MVDDSTSPCAPGPAAGGFGRADGRSETVSPASWGQLAACSQGLARALPWDLSHRYGPVRREERNALLAAISSAAAGFTDIIDTLQRQSIRDSVPDDLDPAWKQAAAAAADLHTATETLRHVLASTHC